ncbi:MAG: aminopeptidase [Geminicoccus sp.]|nr:aminopeptidase [Geminicoccus sp.]
MNAKHPDHLVVGEQWSDLRQYREMPEIDLERLYAYRVGRLREQMRQRGIGLTALVNPISLRYAAEYRTYALFQSHIPTTYVFVPAEGPLVINAAYGETDVVKDVRPGRPLHYFDGGEDLPELAQALAGDICEFLAETGDTTRRVAVEYVNPSLTRALDARGLDVVDGVQVSEAARVIKNEDEVNCIKWSCAVAQLGIAKLEEALRPGVTEVQLWALLNYTNLANNGDWHDGRMLASGDRINPWLQEASQRVIQDGDLVGFDTDMVGPMGYFADISRTLHCGPSKPTKRQRELYQLAVEEVEYNMALLRPGLGLHAFRDLCKPMDPAFRERAYSCLLHGVGMCDEYPQVKHPWRTQVYDGTFEAGMVVCVESYCGAVGERDGVKLEQQVLITDTGYELLSDYPWDARLMA